MLLLYDKSITTGTHSLSAEQSHHCLNVLRMGIGGRLLVSDGVGGLFECEIVGLQSKICTVQTISEEHEHEKRPYTLHLAIAPTKNIDRTEWAVEKMVEVGVDRITPLLTAHSERKVVKMERLEKIVVSAAGQSLKAYMPQLDPITTLKDFLKIYPDGLIAHCNEGYEKSEIPTGQNRYTILIGPEGDFSTAEVDAALAAGYKSITLGSERLRTETAAVYAAVATSILAKR